MKKIYFIILNVILCAFLSCSDKNEALFQPDLDSSMKIIEKNVLNGDMNLKKHSTIIVNTDYFETLEAIINIEDKGIRKRSAELFTENCKALNGEERELSVNETTILQSYFKVTEQSEQHAILIAEYYINEIQNLKINRVEKERCIELLTFYKDYLIYIDFEGEGDLKKGRSCFDGCIDGKATALDNGNWVDKFFFIVGLPETFVAWAISCAWDCIF